MQTTLSSHSLLVTRHISQIQQSKMKTILCTFAVAAFCLLTFSLSTAVPIDSTTTSASDDSTTISASDDSTTVAPLPAVGYVNGSKLVITSVIKTLEFEVALEEEDNSTETSFLSTPFIETEIKILNPALLQAVAAAARQETKPKNETSESSESSESNESD